jgi:hypothetical protein
LATELERLGDLPREALAVTDSWEVVVPSAIAVLREDGSALP